jgi:hypothetical protein
MAILVNPTSGLGSTAVKPVVPDGEIPILNGEAIQAKLGLPSERKSNGVKASSNGSENVPANPFSLNNQYAFTPRKLKVFTIGAGFSGLLMAHKFQHRFPEMRDIVEHTIFEANSDVGGTWLMNNYPGVQCDVPAHIYVSTSVSIST